MRKQSMLILVILGVTWFVARAHDDARNMVRNALRPHLFPEQLVALAAVLLAIA